MAIAPISGPAGTRAYARTQKSAPTRAASAAESVRPPAIVNDIPTQLPPKLQEAFLVLHEQVEALQLDLTAARQRIAELESQVETDDLVPVANRRGFNRDVERALSEVARHNLDAAIMFIDVNRMKAINDTYGHSAGDHALLHVGETLQAHLRTSDSVARIGGDEFAVLLTHVVAEEARAKARQLAAAISAAPVTHDSGSFRMSVSVGVQMLEAGQDAATLLSNADRAMYADKRNVVRA
ncbi:MAG: GGDEF domain-containing protein [Pacificimonas sp.]